MITVILGLITNALYYWKVKKVKTVGLLTLSALILAVISLVITRVGSVPINLVMKTWNPQSPPSDWLTLLERWDLYNAIRTFTCISSFICLLVANILRSDH